MSIPVRGHFRNGKVSGWVAPGDSISTREANVGKVVMSCCMLRCIIVCHNCYSIPNQNTIIHMYVDDIAASIPHSLKTPMNPPPSPRSLNHTITVQEIKVLTPSVLPTSSPDHCSHQRGRFVSAPCPCCTWQYTTATAAASGVLKLTKPKPPSPSWWCVQKFPTIAHMWNLPWREGLASRLHHNVRVHIQCVYMILAAQQNMYRWHWQTKALLPSLSEHHRMSHHSTLFCKWQKLPSWVFCSMIIHNTQSLFNSPVWGEQQTSNTRACKYGLDLYWSNFNQPVRSKIMVNGRH